MKASSIFLNGWIVIILSGLETIQSSIFEDNSGDYEQYVVAPIRPAAFEDSDQYLQIYITSKADTQLDINLPATYLYRVARLTERNDWSWRETIHISSDLKQSAYSKGFHITADHPINIVVVSNNTEDLSLVPYLIFPLPKQNPNEYIISDYPPRKDQTESSFLVATGEYRTEVDVFEPGSIHVPRSHLSVEKYSNYQYGVYYPKDIIGFRVLCSRPAAVYAKQQHQPRWDDAYYDDMSSEESVTFFQVPPLGRLGKRYVLGAPPTGTGDVSYVSLVIVASQPNVSVTILLPSNGRGFQVDDSSPCQCQYDSTGLCQVNCTSYDDYETAKPYVEVKFLYWSPDVAAVVKCDEACLVLVTTPSYGAYDSPTVSQSVMLVAPPGVIPGGVHFFVPPVYDELHARLMAVRVAVPTADIGGLLLDGLPITDLRPLLRYRTAAVSEWTVITIELAAGNHRVVHKADRRVPISVHVRGAMLDGDRQSTFGFPAAFPEPVEPSGDSMIYDTGKKPSQNPSEATNEDNSLTVAVFIFLLAVCAAIVAIIVIIMKNNAMLRSLAQNPIVAENQNAVALKADEHDSLGLDRKIEIEESKPGQDGVAYLEPKPSPSCYEPMRSTVSETSLNETYDVIS